MNVPRAPEEAIERLHRRLKRHALWHSALLFLPPLLAAWYIVFFLYRFAWLSPDAVMISSALSLIAAAAGTAAFFRTRTPSAATAARLLDEKSAAEQRFLTLATLGPSVGPAEFISRLKIEAAALARRIDFKRDFPFRIERSILNSLVAALTALFIFQLVLQAVPPTPMASPGAKLAARANQLAREPRFADLAADMSALAENLDAAGMTAKEKQAMMSQIVEKLDQRIAIEAAEGRDVSVLQETAKQMREEVKRFDESSGIKLPFNIKQSGDQSGRGEGESDRGKGQGGSGEGKGSSGQGEGAGAQKLEQKNGDGNGTGERKSEKQGGEKTKDGQQRNAGSEAIQRKQESSENRPDAQTKQGRELKNEGEREGQKTSPDKKAATESGGSKDRAGAKGEFKGDQGAGESKSEEKTTVRFGEKPSGELKEKDLRYVIVQLPDEGGGASGSRDAAGKKSAGALPSANVPLAPSDEPRAAGEKQMLPLEYRGMIR
jgi:hypothetical protein